MRENLKFKGRNGKVENRSRVYKIETPQITMTPRIILLLRIPTPLIFCEVHLHSTTLTSLKIPFTMLRIIISFYFV